MSPSASIKDGEQALEQKEPSRPRWWKGSGVNFIAAAHTVGQTSRVSTEIFKVLAYVPPFVVARRELRKGCSG